jgi:hypothetical protein
MLICILSEYSPICGSGVYCFGEPLFQRRLRQAVHDVPKVSPCFSAHRGPLMSEPELTCLINVRFTEKPLDPAI